MDGDVARFLQRVVEHGLAQEAFGHPGPWVVLSVDPLLEGVESLGLIGPFDDSIDAMIAAEKWRDNLNYDLTEGDPPWVTYVVPLWSGDGLLKGDDDVSAP